MKNDDSQGTWLSPPDPLNLHPHQVDVWRVNINLPPATVKFLESTLSAQEIQRAERFHFEKDRIRYIVAHGCLRDILSRTLQCEPEQLDFDANPYEKPILKDHTLEFNLSHSGDFTLIAVARGNKVGIDVERIRSDIELENIANRFFSTNEFTELMSLPTEQKTSAFFSCWTRKEAYIKAQGLGLSLPLESFDVSISPNEPAILRATRPDAHEANRWALFSLDVDPEYAAALAVEGPALDLRLWNWNTLIR